MLTDEYEFSLEKFLPWLELEGNWQNAGADEFIGVISQAIQQKFQQAKIARAKRIDHD